MFIFGEGTKIEEVNEIQYLGETIEKRGWIIQIYIGKVEKKLFQ